MYSSLTLRVTVFAVQPELLDVRRLLAFVPVSTHFAKPSDRMRVTGTIGQNARFRCQRRWTSVDATHGDARMGSMCDAASRRGKERRFVTTCETQEMRCFDDPLRGGGGHGPRGSKNENYTYDVCRSCLGKFCRGEQAGRHDVSVGFVVRLTERQQRCGRHQFQSRHSTDSCGPLF